MGNNHHNYLALNTFFKNLLKYVVTKNDEENKGFDYYFSSFFISFDFEFPN